MIFDLEKNEPIRIEKGFKVTGADAILVEKNVTEPGARSFSVLRPRR